MNSGIPCTYIYQEYPYVSPGQPAGSCNPAFSIMGRGTVHVGPCHRSACDGLYPNCVELFSVFKLEFVLNTQDKTKREKNGPPLDDIERQLATEGALVALVMPKGVHTAYTALLDGIDDMETCNRATGQEVV